MPTASATAWYGLHELARIAPTDKVLIRSGTGGVGQAAIAIAGPRAARSTRPRAARSAASCCGTWGSSTSTTRAARRLPTKFAGTPADTASTWCSTRCPGPRSAGIDLLAFGGRFVELGKRDIYRDTHLGLFPFRRNLSLFAVDLALLTFSHPRPSDVC